MRSGFLRIALSVLAILLGFIALVLAILPFRTFALIPGVLGVLAGVPALVNSVNRQKGRALPLTGLLLSFFGLLIAGTLLLFPQRMVVHDEQFQQQIEKSSDDVQDDLNDALNEAFEE